MSLSLSQRLWGGAYLSLTLGFPEDPVDVIDRTGHKLYAFNIDLSDPRSFLQHGGGYLHDQSLKFKQFLHAIDASYLGCTPSTPPMAVPLHAAGPSQISDLDANTDSLFDCTPQAFAAVHRSSTSVQDKTLFLCFNHKENPADMDAAAASLAGRRQALCFYTLLPFIEAAKSYADRHAIRDVVISGHGLGGTMVDLFSQFVQPEWERHGLRLTLLSTCSTGFAPFVVTNIHELVGQAYPLRNLATENLFGNLLAARSPDHVSIYHCEDRESFRTLDLCRTGVDGQLPRTHIPGFHIVDADELAANDMIGHSSDREFSAYLCFEAVKQTFPHPNFAPARTTDGHVYLHQMVQTVKDQPTTIVQGI